MTAPSINYHTDDNARWGTGLERNLTAAEVDRNFYELAVAVVALQENPTKPDNIESINVSGSSMNIVLQSGTVIGPLPLPVLAFTWRRAWEPFVLYSVLDVFTVEGLGVYMVREAHTSGANFDPTLLVNAAAAYQLIWAFGDGSSTGVVYDVGFYYQGVIADSINDTLFSLPVLRKLLLPAAGNQHRAFLLIAPSTEAQVFPIYHDGTQIGSIDFDLGQTKGVVTITADETLALDEQFSVGTAPLADATAAGLSVAFAVQRVLLP